MCAKKAAKDVNVSVNAVALEDDMKTMSLDLKQETPEVTAFSDAGPRRVVGNYDHSLKLDGAADFASGQSDGTLFALLANAGVVTAVQPTGAAAGVNDPNYNCTSMVLSSYSLKASIGGGVEYSAELQGNAALTRAVA